MTLSRALTLAVACSCCAVQTTAAQRPARGPDDVVRAALRADSVGDWRTLLALAHPDAIAETRKSEIRALTFEPSEFFPTQELTQCMKDQMARGRQMQLDSVYQVSSVEALAKLPADSVFARSRRWRGRVSRSFPGDSIMPHPRTAYLGHLVADDSTAYGVLVESYDRLPMPEWPARRPHVLTLRRLGREWRIMLDAEPLSGGGHAQVFDSC